VAKSWRPVLSRFCWSLSKASLKSISKDPFKYFVSFGAWVAPRFGVVAGLCGAETGEAASRTGVVQVKHGARQRLETLRVGDRFARIEQCEERPLEGADAVLDGAVGDLAKSTETAKAKRAQ